MDAKQLIKYFFPISYTIFILGFFFSPSSKFLSNYYYLALVFPFVILILMKKVDFRPLFSSRTFLLITVYLVYMLCTLFWADSVSMSDLTKYGLRVLYVLIFLSVTIYLTQSYETFLQKLLTLLCWAAAGFAVAKILSFYSQHPFPGTRLLGNGMLKLAFRPSSQFGIVAIASTYFILQQRAVKTKLLYLGPLLASLSYMLLAQSKSTLLSLVVTIIAWRISAWLLHKGDRRNYLNQILAVTIFICAIIAVFLMIYPEFYKLALLRRYLSKRPEIWGHLFTRIADAPWFGHGLTADSRTEFSFYTFLHPHSVYVATLLYGGIVGLLLFMAAVISALWQGFGPVSQSINSMAASMVLYGALCIAPNGNMLIHHPKPFWLFFWFPVALVVASEIPGHPLHGEYLAPDRTGLTRVALE